MLEEESSGEEPHSLTRSDALTGRGLWIPKHAWPAKEPMRETMPMDESDSDDDIDKDLAWFFRRFHPDVDKHSQIAWCRTFANCLAAQMPKNRPKTYKKTKTSKK